MTPTNAFNGSINLLDVVLTFLYIYFSDWIQNKSIIPPYTVNKYEDHLDFNNADILTSDAETYNLRGNWIHNFA